MFIKAPTILKLYIFAGQLPQRSFSRYPPFAQVNAAVSDAFTPGTAFRCVQKYTFIALSDRKSIFNSYLNNL